MQRLIKFSNQWVFVKLNQELQMPRNQFRLMVKKQHTLSEMGEM